MKPAGTPVAQPRARLVAARATSRFGYAHHGVHVGHGRVVHYAGVSRALLRGPVEKVSLMQFAGGRAVSVEPHPRARFVPEAIVARARSRLGENRYRLATNHCEHFCEWCLTGDSRGEQIENRVGQIRDAALAFAHFVRAALGIGPGAGCRARST